MEDNVMRARSSLMFCTSLILAAALVGCSRPPVPANTNKPGDSASPGDTSAALTADDPRADVGQLLYKPADAAKFPPPAMPGTDPVVIPNCVVNFEERQVVSSEVEGKIDLIATPMTLLADGIYEYRSPDGIVVTHDPRKFDPKNVHSRIGFNPREKLGYKANPEKWVPYFKLRDGDFVTADQTLCILDNSLVITKRDSAIKMIKASKEGMDAAKKGVQFSEEKIELYKGKVGVVVSLADQLSDLINLSRFQENLSQAAQSIAKNEADYDEAEVMLRKYFITTQVNGIIRTVAKRDGEFVHSGEKIFEIQSTEKIRLDGTMDVQYFDRVKRNMMVTVEPAVPSTPKKSHADHRREVTGVAVTGSPTRPLVVSTSLDGSALVWDPNFGNLPNRPSSPHSLPHPVAVQCVACTPPRAAAVLAVTGADDGKIRVWDLGDPARLPKTPAREPADAHSSGVTAIAISPDGKYAASAAGREVFIWDLAAGKKLYALPEAHRDTITSVSFTPQAQLVTASKDHTLKVWKIGTEKAAVARTIDHRSGVVDMLGVSPDGGRVLFDQDKGRIDLVDLADAQTVGQLTNTGPSVAFATVAVFAPDHADPRTPIEQLPPYMIMTAGGEGDLKGGLQVWQASRAGGRGAEVARLITPSRVTVTCGAFSPYKESPFLVAGTTAGSVHIWLPPSGPARKLEGRITNIDATDPRYLTVRVEMSNKEIGLLDHSAATVIVNQGQQ
jgi:WD40 repeat protein